MIKNNYFQSLLQKCSNSFFSQQTLILVWLSVALVACGGGSGNTDTPDQTNTVISELVVNDITKDTATVSFSTTPATAVTIQIWLSSDQPEQTPEITINTSVANSHSVAITGLWSAAPWRLQVTSADALESTQFQTADPTWPTTPCRTGDLALAVNAGGAWSTFTDSNGTISVQPTSGCGGIGNGARLDFDLGDGEWVVAQAEDFPAPVDLTAYSHLWIPFRGTADVPVALEIKLRDSAGGLSVARLDGGVSIPVWRSWAVDLREFKPQLGNLDLSKIIGMEVAFSWPKSLTGARSGSVELADLQAWNLLDVRPEVNRFERVAKDEVAMAEVATDLLGRQLPHGFVNAWFELEPNLHLYANAMALIVYSLEYERLAAINDPSANIYQNAARNMADSFVAMQTLSARGGAWDDSFIDIGGELALRNAGSRAVWVGSTAWAGMALIIARDILPDGSAYDTAIAQAAAYYENLQTCRSTSGLPDGSITEGTEGNISSHLFLIAARSRGLANSVVTSKLGDFIGETLFDPVQQRFFCGIGVDFGSGFDGEACTLNGSGAILGADGHSCLDVIANWGTEWLVREDRIEDALKGLAYGRYMFPTQSFGNPVVNGLGDIAGPWTATVEHGAGQWAVAGGPDANYVLQQAQTHLCSAGACQGAADDLFTGISWNTVSTGVAPSAWMYLAWHGDFWSRL